MLSTSAASESTTEGMSLAQKVGLFTVFLTTGGAGTFTWMLSTDEDFLFQMRDVSPKLVNLFAPLAGLPVEEATGELDVEAFPPRSIGEIVGDKVKVAVVLRSGKVVLIDTEADTSLQKLEKLVEEKVGDISQNPIVNFDFVNVEEEANYAERSEEELTKDFGIQIPEILPNANRQQLMVALVQCRVLEADLTVNRELATQYQTDTSQIDRALEQIEERKKEIKKVMKKTRR